jgi:hypothetical protein
VVETARFLLDDGRHHAELFGELDGPVGAFVVEAVEEAGGGRRDVAAELAEVLPGEVVRRQACCIGRRGMATRSVRRPRGSRRAD